MTDKITQHVPAPALTGLQIAAPLNPHGQCFGLIPAGGDWLDDLIDWSRRQFKRPEDAQRIAASWNSLVHVPLAQLLAPAPLSLDAVKLRAALADCRARSASTSGQPVSFAAAVVCLMEAMAALDRFDKVHDNVSFSDEVEATPVHEQQAKRMIARAIELLYVGEEAEPTAAAPSVREPYARRATATTCEHEWPAGEGGTDLNGVCTKCGMAFLHMIHMEMP